MKITRTTFKKFIKDNHPNLLISQRSSFDGMVDGIMPSSDKNFRPIESIPYGDMTLGINGIWLVGSSRDFFTHYEENGIVGIEVSNCCGHFIVGVRK